MYVLELEERMKLFRLFLHLMSYLLITPGFGYQAFFSTSQFILIYSHYNGAIHNPHSSFHTKDIGIELRMVKEFCSSSRNITKDLIVDSIRGTFDGLKCLLIQPTIKTTMTCESLQHCPVDYYNLVLSKGIRHSRTRDRIFVPS